MKKILFITIVLVILQSFTAFGNEPFPKLIVAYSNTEESGDDFSFEITFFLSINSLKYIKVYSIFNELENFRYLGKLIAEDNKQYVTFEDYSSPAGMTTLYYFNQFEYKLFYSESFEEVSIPQYFTMNSIEKDIKALSIDLNKCGELQVKRINEVWNYKKDQESLAEIPKNYTILYEIKLKE